MSIILDKNRITFEQLELVVFERLRKEFVNTLEIVLTQLDESLFHTRDRDRYETKGMRRRNLESLMGEVTIKRRYYLDRTTGEYVSLLDQALGLEKRSRVSGGLAVLSSLLAVLGPSFRAASEALVSLYGYRPLSHESLRQVAIRTGEAAEKLQRRRLRKPEGKKKVRILMVEADGYWVSIQKNKKRKQEVRLMLSHEGWRPRTPGSPEYELVERTHYFEPPAVRKPSRSDFWESASRHLYSKYDMDDDTLVVINGDRAGWIRKGIEYFPNAIYQVDRFHVKRELTHLLGQTAPERKAALKAFDESDVQELACILREAISKQPNAKKRAKIRDLCKEIDRIPQSFIDYRIRLEEMGYSTEGLRGLGAMESTVDKFSNRTKKCGRSWRPTGLRAILHGLVGYFENSLVRLAEHASRLSGILDEAQLEANIERVRIETVNETLSTMRSAMPMMGAGTVRTGGMSKLARNISSGATNPI